LVVLSGSGFRQDQLASDVEDFGIESSQELSSKPDPREYYEH